MRTFRTLTSTTAGGLMLAGTIIMAGPANAQDDQNCDDFASQAEAQAHYRADMNDPDGLDADDDGIACENHTGYSDGSTDMTPVSAETEDQGDTDTDTDATVDGDQGDTNTGDQGDTVDGDDEETMVMPEGGAATGGGSTSGIENGGLIAAGGLAFTIGAGGTILAARRARA